MPRLGLGRSFRKSQPHDDVDEQQWIEKDEDNTEYEGASVPLMGKPCANSTDKLIIRATVVPKILVVTRRSTRGAQCRSGRIKGSGRY